MSERDTVEALVRALYTQRCNGDLAGAMAGFAADVRFRIAGDHIPGLPPKEAQGWDNLNTLMGLLIKGWDWSEYHVQSVLIDGDRAVVHGGGKMRYVPTGNAYQTETLDLMTIRNSKIVDFVEFVDTHMLARMLGVAA